MVIVCAYTPTQQALIGLRNRLSFDDFLAVRERVRGIDSITAMMQPPSFGGRVKQGSHSTVTQILGTDSNYQDVVRVYTDQGRFLSESDDLRRRRVAVLGPREIGRAGCGERGWQDG